MTQTGHPVQAGTRRVVIPRLTYLVNARDKQIDEDFVRRACQGTNERISTRKLAGAENLHSAATLKTHVLTKVV